MNYRTELMEQILRNQKAQEMIDYVSRIYGNSYVGLWLFEAIGTVVGEVYDMAAQLRYETSPSTASLTLDYWEQGYGLAYDPTLTAEQRRNRIVSVIQSKGACTPAVLESLISAALGGAQVEIYERTGKNQFTVNIRAAVKSLKPAQAIIDRMKPAHLIYIIQGAVDENATVTTKIALAMTQAELYKIEVTGTTTKTLDIVDGEMVIQTKHTGSDSVQTDPVPSTYDASGNVTINQNIKSSYDSNGNVTMSL